MERSARWARRSRDEFDRGGEHAKRSAIFGIQQGALDEGLRKVSADHLIKIGFDGYAVNGLAAGDGGRSAASNARVASILRSTCCLETSPVT